MLVPNKIIPFDKSLISKLVFILNNLSKDKNLPQLYTDVEEYFEDISEFIIALDALFILGKIDFDKSAIFLC